MGSRWKTLTADERRLPKKQRIRLLRERARARVEERRAAGEDVVHYALQDGRAAAYLTAEERTEYNARREAAEARKQARELAETIALDDGWSALKNAAAAGLDEAQCDNAFARAYNETKGRLRSADLQTMESELARIDERSMQRAQMIRDAGMAVLTGHPEPTQSPSSG